MSIPKELATLQLSILAALVRKFGDEFVIEVREGMDQFNPDEAGEDVDTYIATKLDEIGK